VDPAEHDQREPSPVDARSLEILLGTDHGLRQGHRIYRRIPSDPRCKLCASPFGGIGGALMRRFGKAPWPKNPKYCGACFRQMTKYQSGAEIACSLVFADVRGSTSLAETLRPSEFRDLMNRFFAAASSALVDHDGIVDKYVGDEVMGIFIPMLSGDAHARQAIDGARALMTATRGAVELPIGAGVHSGVAFVGTVGQEEHTEFTAMGDPVNVTARLASVAGAGEILVTAAAAALGGLATAGLEHRRLDIRGKAEPVEVVVLRG